MDDEDVSVAAKPNEVEPALFRAWWWWRVIWTVIRNLLYISLVLLAFDKATSAFENIVLCLLVLVLQSVNWTHTTQLRLTVEEAFVTRRMLFILLKAVGEDIEESTEIVDEAQKKYLKSNPMYYINATASSLVYLILVWKLFTTLVL